MDGPASTATDVCQLARSVAASGAALNVYGALSEGRQGAGPLGSRGWVRGIVRGGFVLGGEVGGAGVGTVAGAAAGEWAFPAGGGVPGGFIGAFSGALIGGVFVDELFTEVAGP